MFKYRSLNREINKKKKKREQLAADSLQNEADIEYIAMMCGIELDGEENGNEQI